MKELNMDYEKIDCCPKGCLLFWKQFGGAEEIAESCGIGSP